MIFKLFHELMSKLSNNILVVQLIGLTYLANCLRSAGDEVGELVECSIELSLVRSVNVFEIVFILVF